MRRRNPPTHDAAAQVRFSSTGLTRTTSWSEKIMSVVGLLVIKPMSQMGHSRPGSASSKSDHVRYAAESGSKFRELAAPRRALAG